MRKMGGCEQHFGVLAKLTKFFNGVRLSPVATKITIDYENLEKIPEVPVAMTVNMAWIHHTCVQT